VALHQLFGAFDGSRDDAGRCVFLKALAEHAALAPVEGKHGAIGHETGKRAVEHRPRDVAAAASRAMADRNVSKSPPHVAVPACAAKSSVQNRVPSDLNSMPFLNVGPGDQSGAPPTQLETLPW